MGIVALNQAFIDEKDALLPITDRGFLFGEGVFTTMRVQEGSILAFSRHQQRLAEQAGQLGIEVRWLSEELCKQLIRVNRAEKGLWRMKALYTAGTELISIVPFQPDTGALRVGIYPEAVCGPLQRIKSLSYCERLYLRKWAEGRGYDEVLILGAKGEILELGSSNIFWFDDGRYYTPKRSGPLLRGIALDLLEEACGPFIDVECSPMQLPKGAELFACNALQGIRPIVSIGSASYPYSERWSLLADRAGFAYCGLAER